MYRFAYSKIQDVDLANDFTQEAFGKLWQNKDSIDFSKNVKSYLFKTTQNLIIDYTRKKSTTSEIATDYAEFDTTQADVSGISEIKELVVEIISELPRNHQEAFILHKTEGFSYVEIAEIFSVSKKTIESWMSNVLKHLRKYAEEHHRG